MTAKPTPFAAQVSALLTPHARRVLPSLATRSAVRSIPLAAIAPMTRKTWSTITADERRAHVERMALHLVAGRGGDSASDVIVGYVTATHRSNEPKKPDSRAKDASEPAPTRTRTPNTPVLPYEPVTQQAPFMDQVQPKKALPYFLPCAYLCGKTRRVGSPLARVWRCGSGHASVKRSRRAEDAA